ncbi:RNA-directed DNA polymerase, eukaryota [Tanacetum coccineum]
MSSFRSKEDNVSHISKSVFVTNFPDNFGSRDLWKLYETYGRVVDVFIPNRISKAGKRFAFVRFIRVDDVDRLVRNLCTLWVGHFHLHANVVRFERPRRSPIPARFSQPNVISGPGSFAPVVKGNSCSNAHYTSSINSPTLVLDDSCVNLRDLSRHVMGKVKDLNSIPNLKTLLTKEGFPEVILSYLGGLWVMLELDTEATKTNLLHHIGVNSWFQILQDAIHDFVSDERVVWVDIEGVPLNVWTRETFLKIGKKWGETMDIEENLVTSFARKRLCIITKQADNILEKFKITFKGKVYTARAKELFAWTPTFLDHKESGFISDDESFHAEINKSEGMQHGDEELTDDSEVEEVSETFFGDNLSFPNKSACKSKEKQSEDPFNIYELLNKKHKEADQVSDPSLSHPPGFTPEVTRQENNHAGADINFDTVKENSPLVHSKVMNNSQDVHVNETFNGKSASNYSHKMCNGGSILDVLDEMIRVGQSMGYDMKGC